MFSISAYQSVVEAIDQDRFLRNSIVLLLLFVTWEWVQRREECPLTFRRLAAARAVVCLFGDGLVDAVFDAANRRPEFIYFAF